MSCISIRCAYMESLALHRDGCGVWCWWECGRACGLCSGWKLRPRVKLDPRCTDGLPNASIHYNPSSAACARIGNLKKCIHILWLPSNSHDMHASFWIQMQNNDDISWDHGTSLHIIISWIFYWNIMSHTWLTKETTTRWEVLSHLFYES